MFIFPVASLFFMEWSKIPFIGFIDIEGSEATVKEMVSLSPHYITGWQIGLHQGMLHLVRKNTWDVVVK